MGLGDKLVEVLERKSFIVKGFDVMADVMPLEACGRKTGRRQSFHSTGGGEGE